MLSVVFMCVLGQGEGSVPNSGHRPEVIAHQPTLMWGLPCQLGSHGNNGNTRDEENEEYREVRVQMMKLRQRGMERRRDD